MIKFLKFSAIHVLIAVLIPICCAKHDAFTEELLLKPLYSDQIYAHFQFSTLWNVGQSPSSFRHSYLFPRIISELIERYNLQELHVSLTGGLWRYETWGYPVVDAAPGAEVWAWFKNDAVDIDKQWKELTNSLSGLLCASLNFIDASNTISPKFTFQPRGVVEESARVNSSNLRYATLPREIVCTENLTPWKKLLPCGTKSGLASLLNSGYIHNTRYHSVALHVRPKCFTSDCLEIALELQQTVSLVYDYGILGTRDWSFPKLFGSGVMSSCPLASKSEVYIDISSNNSNAFKLSPAPDDYVTSIRGGHVNTFAKYVVRPYAMSVYASYLGKQNYYVNLPPALHANQYLTGFGKEHGGIVTKVFNNHWADLDVVVLQNIPWYVPVYLHTLSVKSNGVKNEPLGVKYIPGKQRLRPYHLEVLLRLPKKSITTITIDFDYVFLTWQEYPPDANHGFYIGSAVVSCVLPLARNFTGLPQDGSTISDSFNASRSGYLVQVRTETMVVTLPTPDFSMPYNVICLACTVVALAFGPLHNITTKGIVLKVKDNKKLLHVVVDKVKKLLKRKSKENQSKDIADAGKQKSE